MVAPRGPQTAGLSRDLGDLHRFRKILKHYGVEFVSVSDGMKLDESNGSAMVFMTKSFTAGSSPRCGRPSAPS
jgi:DNA invertase Pin-like site-specific DNA recombinase